VRRRWPPANCSDQPARSGNWPRPIPRSSSNADRSARRRWLSEHAGAGRAASDSGSTLAFPAGARPASNQPLDDPAIVPRASLTSRCWATAYGRAPVARRAGRAARRWPCARFGTRELPNRSRCGRSDGRTSAAIRAPRIPAVVNSSGLPRAALDFPRPRPGKSRRLEKVTLLEDGDRPERVARRFSGSLRRPEGRIELGPTVPCHRFVRRGARASAPRSDSPPLDQRPPTSNAHQERRSRPLRAGRHRRRPDPDLPGSLASLDSTKLSDR